MAEKTETTENTTAENAAGTQASGKNHSPIRDGLGGIFGFKAGMTQVFNEEGDTVAVTVIRLATNQVTQLKRKDKEGYNAVQVGVGLKSPGKANKSEAGHVKASGGQTFYHYQEFRLPDSAKLEGLSVGDTLSPEFLADGDFVDVTAVSKGKGYQGVMKRHHFAGGMASHGASVCHRMPGSIGNRADPARVVKGRKMAGQMGVEQVTIQNVKVAKVDATQNLILVHGSVPGGKNNLVTIRKARKVFQRSAGKAK